MDRRAAHMSQDEFVEQVVGSRASRRAIVKTGAKLAYVAPVVAASMALGAGGAAAISGEPVICPSTCAASVVTSLGVTICTDDLKYLHEPCCDSDADCENLFGAATFTTCIQSWMHTHIGQVHTLACSELSPGQCAHVGPCD
jgi:hypothetical protein